MAALLARARAREATNALPEYFTTTQDEGVAVQVGNALDVEPVGDQGGHRSGQSREFVTASGASEEFTTTDDLAPASDARLTWHLMRGQTVFFRGSYAAALDWALDQHWLERGYHDDGTEFAPRWIGRDFALVPSRRR